jgi:2,4-dienoyl-CoA reductase-like NADH-dependent reductase (Old Yellow Enzyme family)/NAD(P)-dependent dehydrogenase (short-subunit alcohol dehydrogenase family)
LTRPALDHLFGPLVVGSMEVQNRIFMTPMERNFASPDGTVTERTLAHYEACARGGVGWIDVESTFVDQRGRGRTHQLGIHDDRCVPGLRELVDRVHAHGPKIGIELHHAGRQTESGLTGLQPVAPSPVPCPQVANEMPHELTIPEIDEVVEIYGEAARRASEAGFDAVELHSAHGYLPLAFLSPLTNHRTDEYGGSFENRARFAVRALGAIREAVRPGVTVGARFSSSEFLPGGLTVDDMAVYAQILEAAGAQYLNLSAGQYASFQVISPTMDVPTGFLLPLAERIKGGVSIPIVAVSRFTDPRDADRAIAEGRIDVAGFGRAFLTDPEWPRKAQEGRLDEIVHCISCNQGCTGRIAPQRDVTCLVNPVCGRELELQLEPAPRRKRVLVVGGGPAGLEAARVAAERGHDVVLCERESALGGLARLAGVLPHRDGWRVFVEDARRRIGRTDVEVRLDTEVDEELIRELAPDAIVFATGARYAPAPVRGAGAGLVADPVSTLRADAVTGDSAVVVGGSVLALGMAEWLASRGVRVTVVAPGDELGDELEQPNQLPRVEEEPRITIERETSVLRAANGSVFIGVAGAIGPLFERELRDVSLVVDAERRKSENGLAWLARARGLAPEIHEIGDCEEPRSVLEAIYEGAVVGRAL